MCDVLPAIGEETPPSSPDDGGDNSKLEQLMISMLEERDKLMEKLRESQDSYTEATKKLGDVEGDNKVLLRQLQALMPQEEDRLHSLLDDIRSSGGSLSGSQHDDLKRWPIAKKFLQLARELSTAKERVEEKEEEVEELKSERNNTRLLLEHLECLVARHERSLRMTVIKRQTSSAGVSSEVEVLKALKSLFDHHKALDEKVRERLRTAQERNIVLEDELMLANQEIKSLQDENKRMKRMIQQRNSVRMSMCYDNISFTREQLALLEDRDQTIGDLQFSLDEKDAQLEEALHLRDELAERAQELEEELTMAISEMKKLNNANKQMNDAVSEHTILESRVSELESLLSQTQTELSSLKAAHQGVMAQLTARASQVKATQDELGTVKFELKQKELALTQARSSVQHLVQKQDKQINEAAMKKGTDEHRIRALQEQLDLKIRELVASQEKENIHEANVTQLQLTVDRMLNEARERQTTYSSEKKQLLDDKTHYQKRCEGYEKELVVTKQQNKRLKEKLEALRNHLKQNGPTSTSTQGVLSRASSKKTNNNKFRYSWHVTDLDELLQNGGSPTMESPSSSTPSQASTDGPIDKDKAIETAIGESISDFNPSQFASMLEETISKMDKQLESMGENMDEADEFDKIMQSVAEGTYHPTSSSSAMETFPHSNMPVPRHSKRKMQPNAVSRSALYRVNLPSDIPEDQPLSPVSTNSNDSISSGNGSTTKLKASIKHKSSFSKLFRRSSRGSQRKKNSQRRASAPVMASAARRTESANTEPLRDSVDFSDLLENSEEREEDRKKKSALLSSVLERGTPFSQWDSSTIVAWLEVWVVVPFWYIAAIRSCLQSGEMLANITESELETELGITNTLHRLKLRLAVQEIVSLTCITKHQRTTSLFGEMSHEWVSDYWLPSLGLPQYVAVFKAGLVDARMLEHLTKKDLRTVLKMIDAGHRNSLQYGISVLKKLDYNRNTLEERRQKVSVETRKDVLVWTNDHVIQWVESLGLADFATNLRECGVHGGVIALDSDFDHDKLALALQIPLASTEIRKQLKTEFGILLSEGTKRASSESQSHGRIVRKLSKRLKVGSRKTTMATMPAEMLPMRPSSPVLFASRPTPLYQHSLLEKSDSGSSGNTTGNSLDDHFDFRSDSLKDLPS